MHFSLKFYTLGNIPFEFSICVFISKTMGEDRNVLLSLYNIFIHKDIQMSHYRSVQC